MNIACIQMNSTDVKQQNLDRARELIHSAAEEHADIVCLPETFNWIGPDQERIEQSEPLDGPTYEFLSETASEEEIYLHGGSFFEETSDGGSCFNTTLFFNPDGTCAAIYRKIHLFDAEIDGTVYDESTYVTGGEEVTTADTEGMTLGFSICYDLRFCELYRLLSERDVHIVFVPAAFTRTTGTAHWEVLLRARAIENQVFVAAPAQVGTDTTGREYYGNSMIIGPWGNVLSRCSDTKEGIAITAINKHDIYTARTKLPVLEHRKL